MSATLSVGDLMIEVVTSRSDGKIFTFVDYEPRGVPGYESDIARVYGCSQNQTQHLLDAVDELEQSGQHFSVIREVMRPRDSGLKGEVIPAKIRVTVRPD